MPLLAQKRCRSVFVSILNAHLYSHLLVQPYLFFFLAEQEVPDGVIPRPTFQLLLSGPDTFAGQIRYIWHLQQVRALPQVASQDLKKMSKRHFNWMPEALQLPQSPPNVQTTNSTVWSHSSGYYPEHVAIGVGWNENQLVKPKLCPQALPSLHHSGPVQRSDYAHFMLHLCVTRETRDP